MHASPTSFLNYATLHYVEMLHQNKNGQLSVAQIGPDQQPLLNDAFNSLPCYLTQTLASKFKLVSGLKCLTNLLLHLLYPLHQDL